jgi:hypothetical protein
MKDGNLAVLVIDQRSNEMSHTKRQYLSGSCTCIPRHVYYTISTPRERHAFFLHTSGFMTVLFELVVASTTCMPLGSANCLDKSDLCLSRSVAGEAENTV